MLPYSSSMALSLAAVDLPRVLVDAAVGGGAGDFSCVFVADDNSGDMCFCC
jgi:hypothetical protein